METFDYVRTDQRALREVVVSYLCVGSVWTTRSGAVVGPNVCITGSWFASELRCLAAAYSKMEQYI